MDRLWYEINVPFISTRKSEYKMSILRIHLQYLNDQYSIGRQTLFFIKKLHEKNKKKRSKIRLLNIPKGFKKGGPRIQGSLG